VLRARTALRLGVQGAKDPHNNSVAQEGNTLVTEVRSLLHLCRHFGMVKDERSPEAMPVVSVAVHGEKADQLVRVFLDLIGV